MIAGRNIHVVRDDQRDRAVVFVHGFMGDPERSWAEFSRLLADDAALRDWDLLSFGYTSRVTLEAVSLQLATQLANDLARYRQIAFVAHSTGALVVQLALLDHPELWPRVSHAFFFASPNLGMRTPGVIPLFGIMSVLGAGTRQLENVAPGSPFLENLNHRWTDAFGQGAPFHYWAIAGVQDSIVPFESLTAVPADHRLAIPGTHVSIIKPQGAADPAVQIVRSGLLEQALPKQAESAADPAVALKEKIDRGIVDVFLHCATSDRQEVRDLSVLLTQLKLRAFLIEDAGAGRKWEQELAERIVGIRSVAICIGRKGAAHIGAQRDKVAGMFATRSLPVIPTFLETCPEDQSDLSDALSEFIPVDFRDPASEPLEQLRAGITGNTPAVAPAGAGTRPRARKSSVPKWMLARRPMMAGAAAVVVVIALALWTLPRDPDASVAQRLADARKANVTDPQYLKPATEAGAPSAPHSTLLLFIHGIFGDTVGTWSRSDRDHSLPSLILARPEFSQGFDAFAFGYTSDMLRTGSFQIPEAATALITEINFRQFLTKYDRIVIVAHSMGGLVALEALTMDGELRAHVPLLVTYATPYEGSQVAVLASDVLRNPALRDMLPDGNAFLDSLENSWTRIRNGQGPRTRVICAYEKATMPGIGYVVPPRSARAMCDTVADPIAEDHIGIVKPNGPEHSSIKVLTNALRTLPPISVPPAR